MWERHYYDEFAVRYLVGGIWIFIGVVAESQALVCFLEVILRGGFWYTQGFVKLRRVAVHG